MQTLLRRIAVIFIFSALIFSALTLVAYADLKITTKNTMANQTTQGTTYIKGSRQRSERQFGPMHQVTITQCDRRRIITVSDACRTYMVAPMDQSEGEGEARSAPPPDRSADSGPTRRGGTITINASSTNTGETERMFGYTARHIKSRMSMTSSPDACNPSNVTMETDGWYADFSAAGMTCSSTPRPGNMGNMGGRVRPDCQDRIRYTGSGMRSHGYPMRQTMTTTTQQGQTFTMTEETTELSRATLDPALFEVPADYQQVDTYQGLMCQAATGGTGAPPPRRNQDDELQRHRRGGGALCVAPFTNKASTSVDGEAWRDTLIDELGRMRVDSVKLDSTNAFDLRAEAAEKGCGHILYTDVMELRAPATRRYGNYRSSLHVELMATDDFTPWLDTTVTGTGTSLDAAGEPALRSEAEQVATELARPH